MMTPCQQICQIDPNSEKCVGCHRTRQEITDWQIYTDEQRLAVMQRLYYENDFVIVRLQR
ncbi:MAG: DUF1289 domain-containing protein [Flavobacteriia bacterium]|nr:DUF1289 domain-containing protein [Flavobacteriia bacterium]